VPLWFFPQNLQYLFKFLPFVYIYQLPLSIYIGKLGFGDLGRQMGIQLIWLLVLYVVFKVIQKTVLSNIIVQGG